MVDIDRFVICKFGIEKFALIIGQGGLYQALEGRECAGCKVCGLSHKNRLVFNKYLDYTRPMAFGKTTATIGLGDRLGLASPAHIRVTENRKIKPILAQQSKRELNLTGRTYRDVLDDVCFAVLQEGYRGGFGADGDHLKEAVDIKDALDNGYSMITLDCSEQINSKAENYSKETLQREYLNLPDHVRKYYEEFYLNKTFTAGRKAVFFGEETLVREVLLYDKAIHFMENIYKKYIVNAGRDIDFEISLDETEYPTTGTGHFLVACELQRKNIHTNSMAPRFIGEFQKGIDYIGDIDAFEADLKQHAQIADYFGYKLSIHSGSDKFGVFGLIGQYTQKQLHIKTSGTNWLEAIKVIISKNPCLYRKMHQYSLKEFNEAKAYYHVDADPDLIKKIDEVKDEDLIQYMSEKNARQLMHITYGFLLNAEENGQYVFKNDMYATLVENEELYYQYLIQHIGKHLDSLGIAAEHEEQR